MSLFNCQSKEPERGSEQRRSIRLVVACGAFLLSTLSPAAAPGALLTVTDPMAWRLLPQAQSHAPGIYLNEIADSIAGPLPHIRLAPAPAVGQATVLTRAQVNELLLQSAPDLVTTNWAGAKQIRVTRRMRLLEETEAKELLTTALSRDFVKDRGELELRLGRPWAPVPIADDPFTVAITDMPTAGVAANFIVRFELRSGATLLGNWQVPVQARIWREVWVAGSALLRGQLLRNADVTKERRDMLTVREALPALDTNDPTLEFSENLPAGTVLTARSLRIRPIVQRGRVVEAIVQDGALTISVKAEVLEDGIPGQSVRARNMKSRREFRGKVQNEETIVVAL